MNIVSGAGKRAYSRYGCPLHAPRGTCTNDLTERSEILESRLLQKLQETVLRPEVVEYTLERFESELGGQMARIDDEREVLEKQNRTLNAEIRLFAAALPAAREARAPDAIIGAINEREAESKQISARFLESRPDFFKAKLHDVKEFVSARLEDLQKLLARDVAIAKTELQKHVQRIDLMPVEAGGERFYLAEGEWDLLGGSTSRKSVGAAGRS